MVQVMTFALLVATPVLLISLVSFAIGNAIQIRIIVPWSEAATQAGPSGRTWS
jgi:hypothetical protein